MFLRFQFLALQQSFRSSDGDLDFKSFKCIVLGGRKVNFCYMIYEKICQLNGLNTTSKTIKINKTVGTSFTTLKYLSVLIFVLL